MQQAFIKAHRPSAFQSTQVSPKARKPVNTVVCTATKAPAGPYKLHYFELPGRGEVSRLCFTLGGIPFENVTYDGKTWQEAKTKMPFGQVPVLEFGDGTMLAQTTAIENYVSKLAGLYPTDPYQAALGDQAIALMNDFNDLFRPTFRLPDAESRIKARQEILAGPGKDKLALLSKLLDTPGFITGDSLVHADLALFVALSMSISGFMDGIPADLLHGYPALKAYRNRVASVPAIKQQYANVTNDKIRLAFKPDA